LRGNDISFTLWAFAFLAYVDLGNTEFPATVFALAIGITDAASTATSYIWCSLSYLFITVNSPVISAIRMANYVFIGPSHKKVKFFVFLCRIIKEVFSCFIVLKSRFLQ